MLATCINNVSKTEGSIFLLTMEVNCSQTTLAEMLIYIQLMCHNQIVSVANMFILVNKASLLEATSSSVTACAYKK